MEELTDLPFEEVDKNDDSFEIIVTKMMKDLEEHKLSINAMFDEIK